MTRLSEEFSSFLRHHSEDLPHNHLATLVVSITHSDCHFTMRTGESMQRVKLVARMPCSHSLCFSRCWGVFLTWGPELLKCYGPSVTLIRYWVDPAPGHFRDTKVSPNRLRCTLYSTLNAIVMSCDTRLQQWICKPLMFLWFYNLSSLWHLSWQAWFYLLNNSSQTLF